MSIEQRAKELIEAMYKAEISYGSGFYNDDEWNRAYDELGELFGFDREWRDAHEHLHTDRWEHLFKRGAA